MDLEGIIAKIKKAMRLAQKAGTDGERVAAERAAHRLAESNGIDISTLKIGDSEAKAVIKDDGDKLRHYGAESGFAYQLIRKHFGVIVMEWRYKNSRSSIRRVTFFGVNINIEIAKYVYVILMREFHKDYKEVKGWGLDKRSFMTGWFMQIDKKLTENPLRNDREQFEAEKEAAERKFKEYQSNPDNSLKFDKVKRDGKDAEALYRGFRSAEKVNLSRPCEGQASASPFSLGHTKQLKEAM